MKINQSTIHGRFEVAVSGQVLISRTWGPFNLECIHAYREHMNLHIQSLVGQRWAMLALACGEPIHTPESLAEMVNTIEHQRTLGRCATAIVLINVEGANMVKLMLSSMYEKANEPFFFAEDEASAMSWLKEQIASSSSD
jgi:hypothetical protein